MEHKEWKLPCRPTLGDSALTAAGLPPLLAAVMTARGCKSSEDVDIYLDRSEGLLQEPWILQDMDKAVNRILTAIKNGERTAVYGDYDVDGITASCLLTDYLRSRGLDCEIYIPDRLDEGYGLNTPALETLRRRGVSLVITVDCGITAVSEAEYAHAIGLDIIITDHHECQSELPIAAAVVDPKRQQSCASAALAGVGVAFKLVCALEGDHRRPLEKYCDLVAMGTVADVMPLEGENRFLVWRGLQKLKNDPRPGFKALLEQSGTAQKPITSSTLGYSLSPRINAAGRLCRTEASVDLMLTESVERARRLAVELCDLNRRRQELEMQVWNEAQAQLDKLSPDAPIVLASDHWHPGVVGIAASRISEQYRLPTIIICLDGDEGKGSCRSYGGFNLYDALECCSDTLVSFGGHFCAAGLNICRDRIDDFRSELSDFYRAHPPTEKPVLAPEILISDTSWLSEADVEALEMLEPCGSGNPRPMMCICGARLLGLSAIGAGKHSRMKISKGSDVFDCVYFSCSPEQMSFSEGDCIDLCFLPQINEYHGHRNVQLVVTDARPSISVEMCRHILMDDGLEPDSVAVFRPGREELACVWRSLEHLGGKVDINLTNLCTENWYGSIEPVKLCLCIRIFYELGLLSLDMAGKRLGIIVRSYAKKTALEKSALYSRLWSAQ